MFRRVRRGPLVSAFEYHSWSTIDQSAILNQALVVQNTGDDTSWDLYIDNIYFFRSAGASLPREWQIAQVLPCSLRRGRYIYGQR